jgi:hypothetical protein
MKFDAIPDLSDPQVIIFTEWMGRSPTLVEDQVTYPIVSRLIGAPRVVDVRGFSMFGMSFLYVLFEEGTDLYWARSRVLEYLSSARDRLPEGVNLDDRELTKIEAMISSMTREERTNPQVFVATTWEDFMATSGKSAKRRRADFDPGRVKRVSRGSGRTEQDVKELLQKFAQMRQMMVQLGASTGLMGKIPGLTLKDAVLYGAFFGICVGVLGALPNWVWWKFPLGFSLMYVADAVIAWTAASVVIARWCQASACALPSKA